MFFSNRSRYLILSDAIADVVLEETYRGLFPRG